MADVPGRLVPDFEHFRAAIDAFRQPSTRLA
jgi:hypothetical protein